MYSICLGRKLEDKCAILESKVFQWENQKMEKENEVIGNRSNKSLPKIIIKNRNVFDFIQDSSLTDYSMEETGATYNIMVRKKIKSRSYWLLNGMAFHRT